MKVLHISTSMFGGAGRAAYRLHQSLTDAGIDSSFLCIDTLNEKNINEKNLSSIFKSPSLLSRIKNKLLRLIGIKNKTDRALLESEFNTIYPLLNCEMASLPFSKYKLSNNPLVKSVDVIILHWVAGMLDYAEFFTNINKPVIWTLHDMNPFQGLFHYKNDELINAAVAGTLDQIVRNIKHDSTSKFKNKLCVVTPSEWLKTASTHSEILGQYPTHVIPYSLNLNLFNIQEKKYARNNLNIPADKTLFLFVSESINNYRKGFDLLLDALKLLPPENIVLVALGNNTIETDLKMQVINAGLITEDTQLARYYAAADAFVLPSREDNLPNVMLESFACGTPVIGFPVGGIKEHVTNFETGILAEDISANALANALILFIKTKENFNSKLIRHYAESKFNSNLQSGKYLEIFNTLV